MALTERNLSQSKSKSRTVSNKKLTLSSTSTVSVFESNENFSIENKIPPQPFIKEPVLIQSKRTLSKCKAKIDLKTIQTPVLTPDLSKSKTTLNISHLNENKQTNTPRLKGLQKSKTSAKLVPFKERTELNTFDLVPKPKTLSKSGTTGKLPSLNILAQESSSSLSKSKIFSTLILKDEIRNKKTPIKTSTNLKLHSVVGESDFDTKDEKKILSKYSLSSNVAPAPRRRSSRASLKLQPLEVFSSGIDIDIEKGGKACHPISTKSEKQDDCKKTDKVIDVSSSNTNVVPEKCQLKKSKAVTKQKNILVSTNPIPNSFRKTRSQSLMQKSLTVVPEPISRAEIDQEPSKPEIIIKPCVGPLQTPNACQTPQNDQQVGDLIE